MNFKQIKHNFDRGLWSVAMVRMAVKKGIITVAQFEDITGTAY